MQTCSVFIILLLTKHYYVSQAHHKIICTELSYNYYKSDNALLNLLLYCYADQSKHTSIIHCIIIFTKIQGFIWGNLIITSTILLQIPFQALSYYLTFLALKFTSFYYVIDVLQQLSEYSVLSIPVKITVDIFFTIDHAWCYGELSLIHKTLVFPPRLWLIHQLKVLVIKPAWSYSVTYVFHSSSVSTCIQ